MMSASKMSKAQQAAEAGLPYSQGLYEIVNLIGKVQGYKSPYIHEDQKEEKLGVNNALMIIVGSTRGFVGSMTNNLAVRIQNYMQEQKGLNFSAVCVNALGAKMANMLKIEISHSFLDIPEMPSVTDLQSLIQLVQEIFIQGEAAEVHIAYTHFVNSVMQEPIIKRLLPIRMDELAEEVEQKKEAKQETQTDFIFEPGKSKVLDRLLPEYFEMQILSAILDSKASEESARMIAMQNATENALELKDKLFFKYNRTRQSKITSEIIDIVSGAINS